MSSLKNLRLAGLACVGLTLASNEAVGNTINVMSENDTSPAFKVDSKDGDECSDENQENPGLPVSLGVVSFNFGGLTWTWQPPPYSPPAEEEGCAQGTIAFPRTGVQFGMAGGAGGGGGFGGGGFGPGGSSSGLAANLPDSDLLPESGELPPPDDGLTFFPPTPDSPSGGGPPSFGGSLGFSTFSLSDFGDEFPPDLFPPDGPPDTNGDFTTSLVNNPENTIATPEPGSLLLLGSGLAAAWHARRRKKNAQ